MQSVELSQQQSGRMAELPEDYPVLVVPRTPVVRKPTGRILRINQNGRLTAARRRLAVVAPERLTT
jgi:hypothetical protein